MKYNEQRAIDSATDLFWKKGFQGAGMRDIQQALDMRPGSIYARFENKEGLFTRVINQYAEHGRARLQAVSEHQEPLVALRTFFVEEVTGASEKRYKRQCLLVKSLAEFDNLGEAAKQAILNGMDALHEGFGQVVAALSAPPHNMIKGDESLIAHWLQEQFVGLRTLAVYASDARINLLIDKLLLDLKGHWPALNRPASDE
ncbi:TetR/AcrR family transcriptional regulator [Alteromonas sp. ASW11-19]|uniref:TetR/AcrR family transcriptional regulator n=1 Tax=Alteromonas salexigens TaxID=2982530 RepID=A0ABT2VKJ9_9ALTE|nr:TetR/AcrR family transcriptional regulator [Alteromonas salexigens]MCU7553821.1 TetR/AcrR family transcriptional regulator [Alteromonas salexigens]